MKMIIIVTLMTAGSLFFTKTGFGHQHADSLRRKQAHNFYRETLQIDSAKALQLTKNQQLRLLFSPA